MTSLRKYYQDIFRRVFCENLMRTRAENGLTQAKMAEMLVMDDRSYIELDHGKSGCSALTLALYLIYCCADAGAFLRELREAFEKGADSVA